MSIVHVVAPPPVDSALETIARAVRRLKARGVMVRWTTPPVAAARRLQLSEEGEVAIASSPGEIPPPDAGVLSVVERAVVMRAVVANRNGERALRKAGARVVRATRLSQAALQRGPTGGAVSPTAGSPKSGRPERELGA